MSEKIKSAADQLRMRILWARFWGDEELLIDAKSLVSDGRSRQKRVAELVDAGLLESATLGESNQYLITETAYDSILCDGVNLAKRWEADVGSHSFTVTNDAISFFSLSIHEQKAILESLRTKKKDSPFTLRLAPIDSSKKIPYIGRTYTIQIPIDHPKLPLEQAVDEAMRTAKEKYPKIEPLDVSILVSSSVLREYAESYIRTRSVTLGTTQTDNIIEAFEVLKDVRGDIILPDLEGEARRAALLDVVAGLGANPENWAKDFEKAYLEISREMRELTIQLRNYTEALKGVAAAGGWVKFVDKLRSQVTEELRKGKSP